MHANMMSKIFGGDSSSSAIFENLDALNVGPLEVSGINLNLVILSDSFGSGEGSIESGDEPFRALIKGNVDGPSEKDEVMNSCSLDMRIVVFLPLFLYHGFHGSRCGHNCSKRAENSPFH